MHTLFLIYGSQKVSSLTNETSCFCGFWDVRIPADRRNRQMFCQPPASCAFWLYLVSPAMGAAHMRQLHADLMMAAGIQPDIQFCPWRIIVWRLVKNGKVPVLQRHNEDGQVLAPAVPEAQTREVFARPSVMR